MKSSIMSDAEWMAWQKKDGHGVKCKWLECYAGTGLAGNGTCFAGGDWTREDCPEYKNEIEWIKEQEAKP